MTPILSRARASSPDLSGRTAIVTGASRGIGPAAAQALAAAGANVALTSCKQEAADEAAARIVGSAMAFLASDAASWVTGETLVIDGDQRLGEVVPYRNGATLGA
ncbi:SDR family NAD(P)-dependent oxidoreductase [Nocardia beijingensis]|uniref:SDR family NAD(P)-dependent oxidoreductase n=1 Tax=Nocardia beijingensis TaxID=95162 RepID=UPI00332F9131